LCFRITRGPGCAPGLLYLVGGFYRYQAAQALGWSHIRTIVREGTRSDALDAAAADNAGALQKPRRPVMREVKEMTMRTIVAGRS
jgi:ParB-like chromosome segregation protein Spo0J